MAKKRNHDLAFLTGADPDAMDPELRAWYMAQRRLILSDISTAPSDTTYGTPTEETPETSSASPAETPPAQPPSTAQIDLDAADTAAPSSAPAPTTTPIDLDTADTAVPSPASI